VLLGAVAEEALFRRVAFAALEPAGAAIAIGITSLLFAAIHLPLYGVAAFPVDLGAGLLLGWQRWASGTWTVPAATHSAANILAVVLR
jgi:membrane protease YdiL (CAAX protease family)